MHVWTQAAMAWAAHIFFFHWYMVNFEAVFALSLSPDVRQAIQRNLAVKKCSV